MKPTAPAMSQNRFDGLIAKKMVLEMTDLSKSQLLYYTKNELVALGVAKKLDGRYIYHQDVVPYLLELLKEQDG